MRRLTRIADWPFLLKVGLAPLLALIASGLVVSMAARGLSSQSGAIDRILAASVSSRSLSAIAASIAEINGNLYHALTRDAAHEAGFNASKALRALQSQADEVQAMLASWRNHDAAPGQRSRAGALIASMQKYKGTMDVVFQMADVDFTSAFSFLKPFDENFAALTHETDALVDEVGRAQQHDAMRARAGAHRALMGFMVASLCGLLITLVVATIMALSTVRAIRSIAQVTTRLAKGDTTTDTTLPPRGDELGDVVSALDVFRENLLAVETLRRDQEQQKHIAETQRRAGLMEMADNFEGGIGGIVRDVSAAAREMQTIAQSMSVSADSTNVRTAEVSASAENSSQGVQSVATAVEELAASSSEISRQVGVATELSSRAVGEAQRTDTMVRTLSEAGVKIGIVVELIRTIAARTNLLALNATIEAARAGEAGRGFAVVASEVKMLAQQTHSATRDIATEVEQIQLATRNAVEAIDSIGRTIEETSRVTGLIANVVSEQGAATNEIARSIQKITTSTQRVTSNIGEVSQAVSDTGNSATVVLVAARQLSDRAVDLTIRVDNFVSSVRAA